MQNYLSILILGLSIVAGCTAGEQTEPQSVAQQPAQAVKTPAPSPQDRSFQPSPDRSQQNSTGQAGSSSETERGQAGGKVGSESVKTLEN